MTQSSTSPSRPAQWYAQPPRPLATCEICRARILNQAAYHGYVNHPQLHYTLCERCALDYAPHIAPALAIAEARRIIAAHQRRIGGAK